MKTNLFRIEIYSIVLLLNNGLLSSKVIYPGIGNFTLSEVYNPILRPIAFHSQSPERIGTTFLLHTQKNLNNPQLLNIGDDKSIRNSYFNGSLMTKIIVHGYVDNQYFGDWFRQLKDEFLRAYDLNVIIVDWSGGNFPYFQAVANTRVIGPLIALLINDLKTVSGLKLSDVHILGHSLGAHIAGYAGEKFNGQLGRITGWDPAGPLFEGIKDPREKLDPTDAQFVDVIHSDGKSFLPEMGLGAKETSGHIDFYPNGGRDQPGCLKQRLTGFIEGFVEGGRRLLACDHMRSIYYYQATLNLKHFTPVAYSCSDYQSFISGQCADCGQGDECATFGEEAIKSIEMKNMTMGKRFYLMTSDKYPYFFNEYQIRLNMGQPSRGRVSRIGVITALIKTNGGMEIITLNKKEQLFRLGFNYSFIETLGHNSVDIKNVTIRWNRSSSQSREHMWIDSIAVVPLSSPNVLNREQHSKEIKTFCSRDPKLGIPNDQDILFKSTC